MYVVFMLSLILRRQESESEEKEPRFVPEDPPAIAPVEPRDSAEPGSANGAASSQPDIASPHTPLGVRTSVSSPSDAKPSSPTNKMGESDTDDKYDDTKVNSHLAKQATPLTLILTLSSSSAICKYLQPVGLRCSLSRYHL